MNCCLFYCVCPGLRPRRALLVPHSLRADVAYTVVLTNLFVGKLRSFFWTVVERNMYQGGVSHSATFAVAFRGKFGLSFGDLI